MNAESVISKTDCQGRVRTPLAQCEALLDAFECSGPSGIDVAALHGVKYPSFANWVQQRKRLRSISAAAAGPECGAGKVTGAGGSSLRWWEGVVDDVSVRFDPAGTARRGLQPHLPGGVRMGKRHTTCLEGNLVARMGPEPSAATSTLLTIAISSSLVADSFL
jgi:hypothetical protein